MRGSVLSDSERIVPIFVRGFNFVITHTITLQTTGKEIFLNSKGAFAWKIVTINIDFNRVSSARPYPNAAHIPCIMDQEAVAYLPCSLYF